MTNRRNDFEDDAPPPPRRVTVQEARELTGGPLGEGEWVDARSQRAEIVPSHWTQAGPPMLQQAAPPAVVNVDPVWTPPETVSEVGTPVHRAWATLIRAAPLILLTLPVGLAIIWALDVWWAWLIPLWGGLGIMVYLAIVWLDLVHNSPSSTERHRINKAAKLKELELKQTHQLRRAIVEAYLRFLDGKGGGHA
jgi:hypothetical protein